MTLVADGKSSIPPNPETLLYLVGEFKKDQKEVRTTLSTMNMNLASMATNMNNIKEENTAQNDRILELEKAHLTCEAKQAVKGLNARVKRLEVNDREDLKDRADATGSIDLATQQAFARGETSPNVLRDFLFKILPWVVTAAISGAAMGGFYIAKAQARETVERVRSEDKKEEHPGKNVAQEASRQE